MAYDSTAWTTAGNTLTIGGTTLYAYFGASSTGISSHQDAVHYPLYFQGFPYLTNADADVDFGTGTNPDTSFTTADTDTQFAAQITPMMWYVPDNIIIDGISHIEGADDATGTDITRMHLMSFDYTSGSTSTLTNGVIVASSADISNTGADKTFLGTWTVDSNYSSVPAGKVILCLRRIDTDNNDYSVNVSVKYHLT